MLTQSFALYKEKLNFCGFQEAESMLPVPYTDVNLFYLETEARWSSMKCYTTLQQIRQKHIHLDVTVTNIFYRPLLLEFPTQWSLH